MEDAKPTHTSSAPARHQGSCHCGAVRYEALLSLEGASKCNCSICVKLSSITGITKPDAFKLLAGEGSLSEYAWGNKTATRYFCKNCGVHCFARGYLDVLGGDYVALNVTTLDDVDPNTLAVVHFDGRHNNWMAGPRPAPWPVFG
jgi:hypothetical protein